MVKGSIVVHQKSSGNRPSVKTAGFTLVEILIVVVILVILAAIIIPPFTDTVDRSRNISLLMDLRSVRVQIELYRQQHNDAWPFLANLADEMTLASDASGNTATLGTNGFPYGPYMSFVPRNPNTNDSTIGNNSTPGSSDWYYDENTGNFMANDSAQSQTY